MDWQPIETAPKDGSVIVLLCRTRFEKYAREVPLPGMWMHDGWRTLNSDEQVQRAYPTHWMPLPAPPKEPK